VHCFAVFYDNINVVNHNRLVYLTQSNYGARSSYNPELLIQVKTTTCCQNFRINVSLSLKSNTLTLSPPNELSSARAKFLVCFNFQSASMSLKVGENAVRVSNSLDPDETAELPGGSSGSKLYAYGPAVLLGGLRVKVGNNKCMYMYTCVLNIVKLNCMTDRCAFAYCNMLPTTSYSTGFK